MSTIIIIRIEPKKHAHKMSFISHSYYVNRTHDDVVCVNYYNTINAICNQICQSFLINTSNIS